MSLGGAIALLIVGLLLIFLTVGVFHVLGVVCAVVGVIVLIFALVNGPYLHHRP